MLGCATSSKNKALNQSTKRALPEKKSEKSIIKNAQVIRLETEVFKNPNFEAPVIAFLNPGKVYKISTVKVEAFYKILIAPGQIGYVLDSDLDIEGQGRLKEKDFLESTNPLAQDEKDILPDFYESKEDTENSDLDKQSYHGLTVGLLNYREDVMGGEQIADMWTLGYKYVPYFSDYATSISWDINIALEPPSYYKKKLDATVQGQTVWGGPQIVGVNVWEVNKLVKYGVGPFLKYYNYTIQSSAKTYNMQGLNLGLSFEAGLVFLFKPLSFDITLRYNWEKDKYATLILGVLF